MKIEQAKQIATKAIEELSHALETGHSERFTEYLAAMARFHRYSWHNIMLIASQRPDATRVAGFHTWKQLGRNVKKGAKGIMILAPVVLRKTKDEASEENRSSGPAGFRAVYVFDQMDTDGKPVCDLDSAEWDPAGYTERLKQFLVARGVQLEYSDVIAPAQGQCSAGRITLLPGQSPAEEFNTLAHETAHSILHMQEPRTETTKCVRGTEAEAVAFVISEAIGLKAKNSADYIHLYAGSQETLVASLERIQQTSAASMEITIARKKGSPKTVQQLVSQRGKPCLDEIKALRRWSAERNRTNEPTSFVFASQKGGSLHPDVINRLFKKYVVQVNANRVSRGAQPIAESACHVHALKHTLCTLAIDAGMDFYKVGLRAGHAALSSTLKYVHGSQVLAGKAWQEKSFEVFA